MPFKAKTVKSTQSSRRPQKNRQRTPTALGDPRLAHLLLTLRRSREWTQAELADEMEVSLGTVSALERATHKASRAVLVRCAQVLGEPIDELELAAERAARRAAKVAAAKRTTVKPKSRAKVRKPAKRVLRAVA